MAGSTVRPNIRIEIHNNLMEPMDIDEPGEEGEISDTNDTVNEPSNDIVENQQVTKQRIWPNANGGFTTGINIFDKEEQSKLQERAKRFSLNANEINNFTDEQLQALHDSLGITAEVEKDIRFEAIHMRGTDEMSTEDVLEYFGKYGPAAIEWIDDTSCNVLWNDKISAARALFFLSKGIKKMPIEGPCDPFVKETVESSVEDNESEGRSILLKNKDREVELREDPEEEQLEEEDTVSVSDISIPVPPGYWRLGVKSIKSKCILLRFAYKSDKKPHKAEKFSEYYKKYGNPNFGGLKGLITETHKNKYKGIFDRNKEFKENVVDPKNPWGTLAMTWSEDLKYCEKEISVSQPSPTKFKSDIMSRLGFKRALDSPKKEADVVEKKTKVPRMRMYADEEEEKIKRKKQLQKLKHTNEKVSDVNVDDLRNILNVQSRKTTRIDNKSENDIVNVDLAVRLKNRSRNVDHKPKIGRSNSKEKEIKSRKSKDTKHAADYLKEYLKDQSKHARSDKYVRRMHSDCYRSRSRRDNYDYTERKSSDEEHDKHKPKSKIAVVIKKQKTPTVASAVWSRINSERERLKTVSESKLRRRRSSSSESSDSSSSSSSSSATSSPESSEDETESRPSTKLTKTDKLGRPGFNDSIKSEPDLLLNEQRNSLRIEISNDHFRNK